MSVKIRLQRHGRKQSPFYHIVIADSRAPRDGRFIEKIGTYNPMTVPATIDINKDKAFDWLMQGAQPTDTVNAILRFKGVLYRKHLERGVKKGAITAEQATEKYGAHVTEKEKAVSERIAKTQAAKIDHHKKVFGTPKPIKKPELAVETVHEHVETKAPVAVHAEPEHVVERVAPVAVKVEPVVEHVVEHVAPVAVKVEPVVEHAAPVVEHVVEHVEPTEVHVDHVVVEPIADTTPEVTIAPAK